MITKHNTVQSTALVPNLDVMDTCYLAWRSIRTGVYVRDTRRFELYAVGIRADLRNWVMRSYRISQYTYARVKGNSNKWSRIPGSRYKCCAAEKKSTCRTTKVLQTKHKWTQLDTRRHKWQLERTLANNSDRHYRTTRTNAYGHPKTRRHKWHNQAGVTDEQTISQTPIVSQNQKMIKMHVGWWHHYAQVGRGHDS